MKKKWISVISLCLSCLTSFAATLYVNAKPSSVMYMGPSEQETLVGTLPYGTPVEFMALNKKLGYSFVKTAKGDEGWIKSGDLTESLTTNKTQTLPEKAISKLDQSLHEWQKPTRPRVMENAPSNPATAPSPASMNTPLPPPPQKGMLSNMSNNQDWFLLGAGVFLGGFLVGFICARIAYRRRSIWV